jgi:hypothetical protein
MTARLYAAGLLVLTAAVAGCAASSDDTQDIYVSTPLAFDPTEEYELATWWFNGRRLLYLGDDGYYAIYDEGNRYRPPDERGQWWKHSYAALWLEPYDTPRHETHRVSIRKSEGALALHVGRLEPFAPLAAPPPVLEDRLLGRWSGDPGRLELRDNMRYVFLPRIAAGDEQAALTRHEGSWSLEGVSLVLQPDSPRAEPLSLDLQERGEAIILAAESGELHRES